VSPWANLLVASALEIAWALGLKSTQGFTRLWPSLWVGLGMVATYVFLARAARHLPIGTAYAVWTGLGAVGAALGGMVLFDEPRSLLRFASIGLIVLGMVGLKLGMR
jgi:quaternary ammonium compound-resistance protein SugE